MAMREPCRGCVAATPPSLTSPASMAASNSCHVLGSGAATHTGTCNSRRTASGFGPRATTLTRARASTRTARGQVCATSSRSARVPTPVRKMTKSNPPARRRAAKSLAATFDSSGTSRSAGALNGCPPYEEISEASSVARRLSKVSTRRPSKLGVKTRPRYQKSRRARGG